MATGESNIVINKSRRRSRKKSNQIPFAIGLIVLIAAVALYLYTLLPKAALMWIFGIALGFVLQKSRFCFTASMRDPSLTGSTSLTRAVLLAIGVATIGFAAIQYNSLEMGAGLIGDVAPWGLNTVAGAFMFGIGMVIAGGCASGTLMRVGEGFLLQILALVFFIVGSVWGAPDYGWWIQNFAQKGVFLPNVFGWGFALVLQLGLLATAYFVARKYGKAKSAE